jgi:hypothetical protein
MALDCAHRIQAKVKEKTHDYSFLWVSVNGDFGIEAEWDTFSREGKPAIECGFICQKHFELYDARTSEPEAKLKDRAQ